MNLLRDVLSTFKFKSLVFIIRLELAFGPVLLFLLSLQLPTTLFFFFRCHCQPTCAPPTSTTSTYYMSSKSKVKGKYKVHIV